MSKIEMKFERRVIQMRLEIRVVQIKMRFG